MIIKNMKRPLYSELSQQPRIDLASAVPLPRPLCIHIDPSSICNFRCLHCPQSNINDRFHFRERMSLNAFDKVVRDIKAMGKIKTCNLYAFGEPLANPLTPDFLKLAKTLDIAEKFIMATNASLLTRNIARALVDNGLDFLRVSIYGENTKTFQSCTGSKLELERIIENVKELKNYRDQVGSRMAIAVKMICTGNKNEQEAFFQRFTPIADECIIDQKHNWNDGKDRFSDALVCNNIRVCPYPFYTLVVHADLTVSACCTDWNKSVVVGHLSRNSLEEIWKGEKLYRLRCALLEQNFIEFQTCEKCTFYKTISRDNLDTLSVEEFKRRSCGRM